MTRVDIERIQASIDCGVYPIDSFVDIEMLTALIRELRVARAVAEATRNRDDHECPVCRALREGKQ